MSLAQFLSLYVQNQPMVSRYSSRTTKKLLLQLVLENIDYRKRCLYLQEIIALSKENATFALALWSFLANPLEARPVKSFSKN